MELFKISILCRDGTSAGSFQMIQALVDCDLAEPGFFVGTVKTGEIFVGGKKNILCQILGVKRIATDFRQMENIKFWYVCIRYSRYSSRVM